MNAYTARFIELEKRIFYIHSLEQKIDTNNPLSHIKGRDLTILMTPFFHFDNSQIDLPNDEYHTNILNYLRNGENPAIIITSHLDRLMIETMKGGPKEPRIFIQDGNETSPGICYNDDGMNMNNNTLVQLVENIEPNSLEIGGSVLKGTESELKEYDLDKFSFDSPYENGYSVNSIFLMFRDKYSTRITENLVKRE